MFLLQQIFTVYVMLTAIWIALNLIIIAMCGISIKHSKDNYLTDMDVKHAKECWENIKRSWLWPLDLVTGIYLGLKVATSSRSDETKRERQKAALAELTRMTEEVGGYKSESEG